MAQEDYHDPALRTALAESMRDQRTPQTDFVDLTGDSDDDSKSHTTPEANIIDLEDEEGDEDLRRAIALSMQEIQNSSPSLDATGKTVTDDITTNNVKPTHTSPTVELQTETIPPPTAIFGIPGLDRKKLEEERLARVAKRKAESSISPPPLRRDAKVARRDVSPVQDSKFELTKSPSTTAAQALARPKKPTASRASTPESKSSKTAQPSSTPSPQFPKGVVKKTWAFGYSRNGDDIKIEEVLQTADLELALLSAFQWDMQWMFTKFRTPNKTRFLMVMQAKEESTRLQYQEETANMPNIRLCFPPMDGQVNCMHSKLMLLFHPEYLRIVVPSANMVPYDWGEQGGVMENTVFLIDLPKKSTNDAADSPKTAFYEELSYFLKASTLHENIIAKLSAFDFKETNRYAFVHTIGGSHFGESLTRTGHCGLGKAVTSLGLKTREPINIDFVTSSIGSLTDEFMRSIYLSAQGKQTLYSIIRTIILNVSCRLGGDGSTNAQRTTSSEWKSRFRVYYPSEQTVSQSKGSRRSAGTICFQEKWFTGPKFPRNTLHDCISRREGLLMHNKMMFVRPEKPINLPGGSNCAGWAYVGSANLSESAWGKVVHDRVRKEPKLNCRNWECGVLVPITELPPAAGSDGEEQNKDSAKKEDKSGAEGDIVEIFGSTVPVPMRVPAPSLGSELKPWYGAW
ncbi:conserved hypothetical protein [Talaromyces marneffei ATCC 18224]|uniref:PLD phosphodiesterase domain-containing protein n=2 Tax=Talaromyces marneffei (strain ATCC 18224 / CBS 334.59 / QM 7333) TaxID=441960 RepID=B6QVB0_TALMQ|nr:conserved hypothetical protein [Talaromyces marneffei ATCC 18224]